MSLVNDRFRDPSGRAEIPALARSARHNEPLTSAARRERTSRDQRSRSRPGQHRQVCPACGWAPHTSSETERLREELQNAWWSLTPANPDQVAQTRHCGRCQPHNVYVVDLWQCDSLNATSRAELGHSAWPSLAGAGNSSLVVPARLPLRWDPAVGSRVVTNPNVLRPQTARRGAAVRKDRDGNQQERAQQRKRQRPTTLEEDRRRSEEPDCRGGAHGEGPAEPSPQREQEYADRRRPRGGQNPDPESREETVRALVVLRRAGRLPDGVGHHGGHHTDNQTGHRCTQQTGHDHSQPFPARQLRLRSGSHPATLALQPSGVSTVTATLPLARLGVVADPGVRGRPGSSFRDTAVREVLEEIGLTVAPDDLTPFAYLSEPDGHVITYSHGDWPALLRRLLREPPAPSRLIDAQASLREVARDLLNPDRVVAVDGFVGAPDLRRGHVLYFGWW